MKRPIASGVAFGVAAGAVWGAVFIAPKITPGFTAMQVSAGRYLAYGVIALILAAPRWRILTTQLNTGDWIALARLGLLGNIVYYIFLAYAVRLAGAAPASFIVGLLPVVITIIGSREQGAMRLSVLAPSLALLRTQYPAEPIWRAVLDGDDAALGCVDPRPATSYLAIWREADGAAVASLGPVPAVFLDRLLAGVDGETALAEAALAASDTDPIRAISVEILSANFARITPVTRHEGEQE